MLVSHSNVHIFQSASSNQLVVPPVKLSAFVVCLVQLNNRPAYLRDPTLSFHSFRRYPKSYYFARY